MDADVIYAIGIGHDVDRSVNPFSGLDIGRFDQCCRHGFGLGRRSHLQLEPFGKTAAVASDIELELIRLAAFQLHGGHDQPVVHVAVAIAYTCAFGTPCPCRSVAVGVDDSKIIEICFVIDIVEIGEFHDPCRRSLCDGFFNRLAVYLSALSECGRDSLLFGDSLLFLKKCGMVS